MSEGFYLDQKKVLEVGKKIKNYEGKLNLINILQTLYDDCCAYVELYEEESDSSLEKELEDALHKLENEVEKAKIATLLTGKYDDYDALITLHAGAGGTEAQDWTVHQWAVARCRGRPHPGGPQPRHRRCHHDDR